MNCTNGTHHYACDCREQHFQDLTRRMTQIEELLKLVAKALNNGSDPHVIQNALRESLRTLNLIPSQYEL